MLTITKIPLDIHCQCIAWRFDVPIDNHYKLGQIIPDLGKGQEKLVAYGKYKFDMVQVSADGQYVILYERLGIKGAIYKHDRLLREINRSFYCAEVYEFPLAIINRPQQRPLLVYCPEDYNKLEIEDLETGARLTQSEGRKSEEIADVFHSRLSANPSGTKLLGASWVWHPVDVISLFDIEQALKNLTHLDEGGGIENLEVWQVSSARFLADDLILFSSSQEPDEDFPPNALGVYSIAQQKLVHQATIDIQIGNLYPINQDICWDVYEFPKIIHIRSGKVMAKAEKVNAGKQDSSIIHHIDPLPSISLSHDRTHLAVQKEGQLVVVALDLSAAATWMSKHNL
ncbi:MAG: hypothetical protein HC880_05070 [Bacteroidia bacterium]|nr:hypothetical protein [Bacteroidia bacterium]